MEAAVAAGFVEALAPARLTVQATSTSSPTKPWKTLRVYHSHFENAPRFQQLPQPRTSFQIPEENPVDQARHRARYLAPATCGGRF
jgi:hypothetical protein